MAPDSFAGAEILDSDSAWVAFADGAPRTSTLDMISAFSDHLLMAFQLRCAQGVGFTEIELQESIVAAHFAVLEKSQSGRRQHRV